MDELGFFFLFLWIKGIKKQNRMEKEVERERERSRRRREEKDMKRSGNRDHTTEKKRRKEIREAKT